MVFSKLRKYDDSKRMLLDLSNYDLLFMHLFFGRFDHIRGCSIWIEPTG